MKTRKFFLLSLAFLAPLAGVAVPTIKITAPTKASTTNGVLNAVGTATGSVPIASVEYSLNGGAWTLANGTNSWSASGLALVPGPNTFSAFAMDTSNGVSKTNTVSFIYIVNVPIQLLTNGSGSITPTKNGALLEIGKAYKLSAKAAKGFAFEGWTGGITNPSSKLSFVMASNLSLTANFSDIARPVCVITFPAVKHSVSNSPITVTGGATDNVGVTAVNYQLNGGGWNPATLNGSTWSAADVMPVPGANTIRAFAQDAAGNISLTNSVSFNYVSNAPPPPVGPAPASLAGLAAQVSIDGGPPPFQISFGGSTFAQKGINGQVDSYAGNYSYLVSSSNTALMTLSGLVPPQKMGSGGEVMLTFVDNSDATFSDTNGETGTITLAPVSSLAPNPSDSFTVKWVDKVGVTNTLTLGGGAFTDVDSDGNVNSGGYVIESFSPVSIMFSGTVTSGPLTGDDLFLQLDFSDASTGAISVSVFDNLGDFIGTYEEPFTLSNQTSAPAGNAPASLVGTQFNVSAGGKTFQVCLGASTYSETSSSSQGNNEVGNYIYMKTGPNTAVFKNIQTLPPNNPGNSTDPEKFLVYFTFSKSTACTFVSTNTDNGQTNVESGSLSIKPASATAPASIAGRTLKGSESGQTDTLIIGMDGTLTHSGSNGVNNSGTYTYTVFSPNCGMLVYNITSGDDLGNVAYVQLTFTSSTGGNSFISAFDGFGNLQDQHNGTFTLQ